MLCCSSVWTAIHEDGIAGQSSLQVQCRVPFDGLCLTKPGCLVRVSRHIEPTVLFPVALSVGVLQATLKCITHRVAVDTKMAQIGSPTLNISRAL